MYAVFELSGFQYRAEEGSTLKVPHRAVSVGESFEIPNVLLVKDKDTTLIGTPNIEGAKVEAEVLGNAKDDKVLIYKYKRRTKYRRTQGHRQEYTQIKIKKIVAPQS